MSKYSKEFKLAVIQHYLSGRGGFKTVADRYGVKYAYVRKWVHAFEAHGQKSFIKGCAMSPDTFATLRKKRAKRTSIRPVLISENQDSD